MLRRYISPESLDYRARRAYGIGIGERDVRSPWLVVQLAFTSVATRVASWTACKTDTRALGGCAASMTARGWYRTLPKVIVIGCVPASRRRAWLAIASALAGLSRRAERSWVLGFAHNSQ